MANWVHALVGNVVGVVGTFTRCPRPIDQSGSQALAYFLLLFVQDLLGGFFPQKTQVASCRNHPQAHALPRRYVQRPFKTKVIVHLQLFPDGPIRQIASCENMGDRPAALFGDRTILGQVDF